MHSRFQPSDAWRSRHDLYVGSFVDYLQRSHGIVTKGNPRQGSCGGVDVVSGNSPFEWRPESSGETSRGVVLVHGLAESPYAMRSVAKVFLGLGFLVRTLLLPGHGTRPGDLLAARHQDWSQAVDWTTRELRREVGTVVVCGQSTGGLLALDLALRSPCIDALVLLSPALYLRNQFVCLADVARHFRPWLQQYADNDLYKYESFTLSAVAQVWKLSRQVLARIRAENMRPTPCLTIGTAHDGVVDVERGMQLLDAEFAHASNEMLLFGAQERQYTTASSTVTCKRSSDPTLRVLNYSHTCIAVHPHDPYYGRDGAYVNCLHYAPRSRDYERCQEASASHWLGESGARAPDGGIVRRLSFNPRFADVASQIRAFVGKLA